MSIESNGARTHEPALRELTAEMDGLRNVMDERDRRYEDRFTAMDEKTSLALTASEKAVVKAETATEKRFDSVNEFRGTLSDQAASLMPRAEALVKFAAIDEKVLALKDDMARHSGANVGNQLFKDERRANLTLVSSLLFGAVGTFVGLLGIIVVLWQAAHH